MSRPRPAEPIFEADRPESRIVAWREALIVHRNAVVERLGIGGYRPCVPGCFQELPHEIVLPNRFGTGQLERAVQRLSEGHIGHDGGDVIRRNGLIVDNFIRAISSLFWSCQLAFLMNPGMPVSVTGLSLCRVWMALISCIAFAGRAEMSKFSLARSGSLRRRQNSSPTLYCPSKQYLGRGLVHSLRNRNDCGILQDAGLDPMTQRRKG